MNEIGSVIATKRLWFLLALAVAAVASIVTYAALSGRPDEYEGRIEFAIPTSLADGANDVGFFIENYRQELESPAVLDGVAAQTGLAPEQISAGLSLDQIGQSNRLAVLWNGTQDNVADTVVAIAGQEALSSMGEQQLRQAQKKQEVVEEDYTAARDNFDTFTSDTGVINPAEQYEDVTKEFNDNDEAIRAREAIPASQRTFKDQGELEALRVSQERLAESQQTLLSQIPEYRRLDDNLSDALSARRDASKSMVAAQTVARQASDAELSDPTVVTVAQNRLHIQAAIIAGLVAAALVVILGVAIDAARARRKTTIDLGDIERRNAPERTKVSAGRSAR